MNIVFTYTMIASIPFLACAALYIFEVLTDNWFEGMFDDLEF